MTSLGVPDTPGMVGAYDPVGAVVTCADTNVVDTVPVAGQPVKRDGRLVHTDPLRAVNRLESSGRYLRG